MFNIEEALKNLPDTPGVYIHKDKLGQVIYVGKAISLRNRVRQYFRSRKGMSAKVRALVSNIAEFEYITCDSEMEALILECTLIKRYMPKYNVLLRDDKTYPYIKVTMGEDFPRMVKTRRVENDGSKYFGPYSDVGAVNDITELLNKMYRLKRCSQTSFPPNHRPCLNYHIDGCRGVCAGNISPDEYRRDIERAVAFLNGQYGPLARDLKDRIADSAEKLDYEQAAIYRDHLASIEALNETQRVVLRGSQDMDILRVISGGEARFVVIFFVREGKLSGRETFRMQAEREDSDVDVISSFIMQYYRNVASGPREILVEKVPADASLLEEYLRSLWNRKTTIISPQKGEKKALMDLAKKDAAQIAKSIDKRDESRRERNKSLGLQIHQILTLCAGGLGKPAPDEYDGREYRVEAYDISNTNGVDSVGAMVVFEGSLRMKKDYRRFKVRTVEGPNDYGSMQEVVYRRFKRALTGDPGFSKMPDLLLIDGGKGHVSAVHKILDAQGIPIPIVGMAKDSSHRTKELVYISGDDFETIDLKNNLLLFKYIGTVQEEVHRFAIDYHKGLRNKGMLQSALEKIDGIGPAKRNALLAKFGSLDNIKKATPEELAQTEGITEKLARNIYQYFIDKSHL